MRRGERVKSKETVGKAASLNKLRQLKTTENVRKKLQSENVESPGEYDCLAKKGT